MNVLRMVFLLALCLRVSSHAVAQTEVPEARAAQLYVKWCQMCHMPDGRAAIEQMNLADPVWRHGSSLDQVAKSITDGMPATAMMSFGDKLSPAEIRALARFVLAFGGNKTSPSATPAATQVNGFRTGDVLALRRASVLIYEGPGGRNESEITQRDLRSNGDRIIVQEVRSYRGQPWVRVLITAGPQVGIRYKMPDTMGWFRGSDVAVAGSARPYGEPVTWIKTLRSNISVARVVDAPVFQIHLKPGFTSGLSKKERANIVSSHIQGVWINRPGSTRVEVWQGGTVVAESTQPGSIAHK